MFYMCLDTGQREENSFRGQKHKKEERKRGRERKKERKGERERRKEAREEGRKGSNSVETGKRGLGTNSPKVLQETPDFPLLWVESLIHFPLDIQRQGGPHKAIGLGNTQHGRHRVLILCVTY